jgi:pimeloyl-ACP methyl ester carboxylesterase
MPYRIAQPVLRRFARPWALRAALLLQVPGAEEPSPHQMRFVSVEPNVRLEVLSFGGTGRPIVLLAGLGNTAHVFDDLGPALTTFGSVYGVTRRGFGVSSKATTGYDVDRLGEDVLAAIDTLRLARPLLVGHSIAGQELSYIASAHPDRIAGVVYLDAAYRYAFDVPGAFERDLPSLPPPPSNLPGGPGVAVPEHELRQRFLAGVGWQAGGGQSIPRWITEGGRQFSEIPVPVLAIFGSPHDIGAAVPDPEFERFDEAMTEWQASQLERGVPGARVLRWRRVSHFFFLTHQADVIREIAAFLAALR